MRYPVIFAMAAFASISQANLLSNGSFESGAFVGDAFGDMQLLGGSTTITGWTVMGDEIAWVKNGNFDNITASDGVMSLDLAGYANSGSQGGVQQSFATVVNQQYLVSLDLGTFSTAWGNTRITVDAAGQNQSFTEVPNGTQRWDTHTWLFTANSTTTTLSIFETNPTGSIYNGLDNISVEAVPEPASMVALGVGVAAMIRRRRSA
ncbi:MAG: DUF642 domain-containing protein [Armatimonadetes bacterium]|nr:DUF642 domain-containing protein [Armatimonadota bacterium]